jgi:pimeloyl-ACP methyl ester carboxylesterase
MYAATSQGDLHYETVGEGVPILLIHPAGATAATWGSVPDRLAGTARVITYDRRGYARTGGAPAHTVRRHTADAAALLETLHAAPAIVVGTSAGAAIAVDLAYRRPDLVRAAVAHEFPWRFTRHRPSVAQMKALAKIGTLQVMGRHGDAAEALLRAAYAYRDGESAWDHFPAQWRRIARENAAPALADFRNSIAAYPSPGQLATIEVPILCTYGTRSPDHMARLVRALAAALPTARAYGIEGAGHAAPFDAPDNFVAAIADAGTA